MFVLRPLPVIFSPEMQKNAKTQKNAKNNGKNITQMTSFLPNRKNQKREIFVFFVITFEPIKRYRPVQHLKMTI